MGKLICGKEQCVCPRSLFKYYSQRAFQSAITDNTFKWEIPCAENDLFEALAVGWDAKAIEREIGDASTQDEVILDAVFNSARMQRMISHVAAFVSFSERGDNILMWAHYSEHNSGACIEFDTDVLKEIDKLEPVTYEKQEGARRQRIPLAKDGHGDNSIEYQTVVRKFLAHKANQWAYEEEWRWIVPPMANPILPKIVDGKIIFVTEIPKNAIKRVIFGYNTSVETRLAWAKQIRVRHEKCCFAEAIPDKNLYKLSIVSLPLDFEVEVK